MTEAVFVAEPSRLLIAAAVGIVLLLLLIIKFKIHPVLSLLISALVIGLGAGMPVPTLVSTVEKGAGETLQGIVLLIGLGSLFGGILEVSGGAQCVAQTLVNKFGEKKALKKKLAQAKDDVIDWKQARSRKIELEDELPALKSELDSIKAQINNK